MRAVVLHRFGPPDVLGVEDVPTPTPADDELLIRVRAATVTAGDCEFRRLDLPFPVGLAARLYVALRKRDGVVPGQELAGEVEAVGDDVSRFEPGDAVFAATLFRFGACAEYVCLPESYPVATIPATVSFADAATIPTGGLNALHFVRSATVGAGETVLVNGAGGSIGTYAVQIATSRGAEVTAVDRGTKLDVLRSVGADHVVDYTAEDFADRAETYDVIVDVIGERAPSRRRRRLNPDGRYVLGNPRLRGKLDGAWASVTSDATVLSGSADYGTDDMASLAAQVESGTIRPVIDRHYPLDEVADAHRYVETGAKTGHVVVDID